MLLSLSLTGFKFLIVNWLIFLIAVDLIFKYLRFSSDLDFKILYSLSGLLKMNILSECLANKMCWSQRQAEFKCPTSSSTLSPQT